MNSKAKKSKKLLLFSPIIIAITIVLLSALFNWRNIDLGFQLTPSMRPYLGQAASIKLDMSFVNHFVLLGDLDITVESGNAFEVWVSPFLEIYAESYNNTDKFYLRSVYASAHEAIAEKVRIVIPAQRPESLTFELSGSSTLALNLLDLESLTLDTLGKQQVYLGAAVQTLTIRNLGNLILTQADDRAIANLAMHTQGNLHFKATLKEGEHQLHNTGTANLELLGEGANINISGVGTLHINQQIWRGLLNHTYQLIQNKED